MPRTLAFAAAALLALATLARAATPATTDQAIAAAKTWLAVVDGGKYEQSWEQSGASFRAAVTREQWKRAVAGARAPLGALRSRTLRGQQEATSLPGAPDGRYVVMQFDASFEHKAAAVETVTTVLENDNAWRVVGYFVR